MPVIAWTRSPSARLCWWTSSKSAFIASAMAIGRVGSHHLRTANTQRDTLVGPGAFPQAGAGDHRVSFLARVLDHTEISRSHEGMVTKHQTANDLHEGGVRLLLGFPP